MDIILFLLNGFMIVKRLNEAILWWCILCYSQGVGFGVFYSIDRVL